MSFDEVRFPLRVKYGSSGGPSFLTEVVTLDSGREKRNQKWSQARRYYDARTGLVTPSDAFSLVSFFHARLGRARGFRLKDWMDYSSASDPKGVPHWGDQIIGTGDGVQTSFQLIKRYGDACCAYQRQIKKPVEGTVLIAFDGVEAQDGWSVDYTTGMVCCAAPVNPGVVVTAGYQFDVPVRFDCDVLRINAEDPSLSQTEVPLIEIRI